MDNIYVIRERIEAVYGKHSKSFDKAFQFILAMITFTMINQNTGFMKSLSSPVISLGLCCGCYFPSTCGYGGACNDTAACTYTGSVHRHIRSVCTDLPDHVYILYQTGTENGICCASDTDCICT